jgi:S-adenosyl-L-methionine hydrolase (adenosine-forming)
MTIITLTSDFGMVDPYVGIMKGVILAIAPLVHLVDLTHDVPPQDIEEGAFVLESAMAYFPPGTVHLAVVDPGVGSARRPLLVTTGRAAFVGPDNGLFSRPLAESGARAWALDRPEYWLPSPSGTFHGRDLFAPVAAWLATGTPADALGSPVDDPVILPPRVPERFGNDQIMGLVIHVDRFGNLITNVPGAWLAGRRWTCEIAGQKISGPDHTYAAVTRGELVLLVSSRGTAEIAVRDGNASQRLNVRSGAVVRFTSI